MRVALALRLICLTALLFASTTPVSAQQKSSPTPQKGAPVAQQPTAQDQFWAELEKLDWKFGPTLGDIAGTASIVVPTGSAFLGSAGTRRFLQLQGNLGDDDNQFTFAPRDVSWFSVFTFASSGYVKDDEKIIPDELLDTLKKINVTGNEERKRRGLPTLVLEGWYVTPHYDIQSKRLEWGTRLRNESGDVTVNYTIRLLGRAGVMSATLVSDPTSLDKDVKSFKTALAGFNFNAGHNYSEFRVGDKVAEYGLAALVVGGAAAAASKSGVLKVIGIGVLGGIAAAWAALRRLFSRKQA